MLYCRIVVFFVLVTLLTVPAAGTAPTADSALQTARLHFKAKDYRLALAATRSMQLSGERDFIAGLAAFRLELWDDAASSLAKAATSYPLLQDYARYYQAKALERLQRQADMIPPLEALLSVTPDSPLARQALQLLADAHFQGEAWANAYTVYQRFIAKYPAGNDSLTATYRSAVCKERLGDPAAAIPLLYRLWLTSPGAAVAEKAEMDLKRLQTAGQSVPVATPEDLFKRAVTLYDLKRYDAAVKALQSIPLTGLGDEFSAKVQLRTGQALFRCKRYKEAELTIAGLLPAPKGQSAEVWYWLARSLDRNDKDREAISSYRTLAEKFPTSDLADDALYQAALLTEESTPWSEAAPLLEQLVMAYPRGDMKVPALWELAWGTYRSGTAPAAVDAFKRLLDADTYRDRAFYWLAKAQQKNGDETGAQTTAEQLLKDYPYGYYAQLWRQEKGLATPPLPTIPNDLPSLLPWPGGFEREKALIALGLTDEARTELVRHRTKLPRGATAAGLARLHLEIDDYNGAFHLLKKRPRTLNKDPLLAWALSYPAAYREAVNKQSRKYDLSPSLVYGVMRTESSFHPGIVSPAGAIGLMQLMPATAALMTNGDKNGNGSGNPTDRLKSPDHNIKLGVRHLRDLLNQYKGDQIFAIAAYNAGSHNVDRWRKSIGQVPADEFVERIPFGETRDYVKKVLSAATVYRLLYPPQESRSTAAPVAFSFYSSLNDD